MHGSKKPLPLFYKIKDMLADSTVVKGANGKETTKGQELWEKIEPFMVPPGITGSRQFDHAHVPMILRQYANGAFDVKYTDVTIFVAHRLNGERHPNDAGFICRVALLPAPLQQEVAERWQKGECLTYHAYQKEYVQATPERGTAKMGKLRAKVEKMNLPNTAKAEIAKAIDLETQELHLSFEQEVQKRVNEKVSKETDRLTILQDETFNEKTRYEKLIADFSTFMSYEQFRLVRSCLHPDRTDIDKAKLNEAFAIFNRLEKAVNKHMPIAELRKRGWAHVSPFYKGK